MPITTRNPLTNTRFARSVADANRSGSSMTALAKPSRDTFSSTSRSNSNWARFSATPVAAGSANYPSVLSGLSHIGSAQTNKSTDISAEALRTRKRHLSTATMEELQKMAAMFISTRSGELDWSKLNRAQLEFVAMAQMFGETAVYNQPGFFEKNSRPEDLERQLRDIARAAFSLPEAVAEVSSLDDMLSDVAGLQALGLDTSKQESWDRLSDLQTGILDPDEYFKDVMNGGSDDGDDSGTVSPGGNTGAGGINVGTGEGTGTDDPLDGIFVGGNDSEEGGAGLGDDGIVGPGGGGTGGGGGSSSSTSTTPDKKPDSPDTTPTSGPSDTEPVNEPEPTTPDSGVGDDENNSNIVFVNVTHNEDGSFTVFGTTEDNSSQTETFYPTENEGEYSSADGVWVRGKPNEGRVGLEYTEDGVVIHDGGAGDDDNSSKPNPLGDDRGEIPENAPSSIAPAPSCPDEELSPVNPDGADIDMNKLVSERISHLIRPNSEAEDLGAGWGPVPVPECDLEGDIGIGGNDGPGSPKPIGNPDNGHES